MYRNVILCKGLAELTAAIYLARAKLEPLVMEGAGFWVAIIINDEPLVSGANTVIALDEINENDYTKDNMKKAHRIE